MNVLFFSGNEAVYDNIDILSDALVPTTIRLTIYTNQKNNKSDTHTHTIDDQIMIISHAHIHSMIVKLRILY